MEQAQIRVVKYKNLVRYRKGVGRGGLHGPRVFAEHIADETGFHHHYGGWAESYDRQT